MPSGDYYRDLIGGRECGLWAGMQRLVLRLASVPYSAAVRARNWLYQLGWKQSFWASVPVISVGNLTVGGTGKTPCVEYVARFCREQGLRVAILSRGYGSAGGWNDEALLLEENLPDVPHLQGADRVALAQAAVEELESEVLVLDDGFQHRRLRRDLDVVLIDATNPWGHGYLLPRGLLREPRSSLRRAGVIVLTRCDQVSLPMLRRFREEISLIVPGVPVAVTVHQPVELVDAEQRTELLALVKQSPVAAFCGIGNPEAFRRTLADLGAEVCAFRSYSDHHAYTRADVQGLRTWAGQQPEHSLVLTTQKDLVKLRLTQLSGRRVWALRVRLEIQSGQGELNEQLSRVVMGAEVNRL